MAGNGMRVILALKRICVVLSEIPKHSNSWLSPEEQHRYESFTSATRRQQFLCARFLARQAISHMQGGAWDDYFLTSPEGGTTAN